MRDRSRIVLTTMVSLVCLVLAGCAVPKVPQSASWDTELAVPLAQHTYWLADVADTHLVRAQSGSGIGMTLPDSNLFFSYIKDISPVYPGDNLKLDPMDYTIEKSLSALRLALNLHNDYPASLAKLNPVVAAEHGLVTDVPAFPFQVVMESPLSNDFTLACVDTGTARVTIRNSLPYSLTTLTVVWMADGAHTTTLYSGEMRASSDTSYSSTLNGQCLSGMMSLRMEGFAGGGSQMLVDSTQGVTVTMSIGDVAVSTYTGILPRQEFAVDSAFSLNQQHDLSEADISSGTMTVTSTNTSPLADSVRLVLDNLRTPSGEPTEFVEFYDPWQTRGFTYDLAGYSIRVTDPSRQILSGRQETVLPATETPVAFQSDHQRVITNFRTSDLRFKRFSGVVHNLEATLDPDSSSVDQPPDGWENVHAANLDLRLSVHSAVSLAANVQVNLHSLRGGSTVGMQQRVADFELGGDTTMTFHGLEGLVTRIPEWMCYNGTVILNGPTTVYDTTSIRGTVVLNAPLRFTMGTSHIPGEVQKAEPEATEDVQQVTLKIRIWNALPLTGTLKLIAAFDSAAVLSNSGLPAETLCVVSLPAPTILGERVSTAGYSEIEVSPPPGSYEFLKRPPFFIRPDLVINGSDGDTLVADGTDFVRFSATANVRYRVAWEGNK